MDMDRFDKSYAYGIRYNYGKEGSQTNWTPWSCMKVIMSPVGAQDSHGCPFKVLDAVSLKAKLGSYGFSTNHVSEVVSFASKGHFQVACAKYFEVMHETKLEEGVVHPNQYFEKSQGVIGERAEAKGDTSRTPKMKNPRPSQKDVLLKRTKQSLLDEYDDELWDVTQKVEVAEMSKANQQAWENDDDDFDMSQVEEFLWFV